jgi:SanA protein
MKKAIKIIFIIFLLAVAFALAINFYVVISGSGNIVATVDSPDIILEKTAVSELKEMNPDCILVLGAAVKGDVPSKILKDRLDVAIALYEAGVAPKLLLSGDNGQVSYNEVKVMAEYVLAAGVPDEDIFLDHAGFSTYESMYRARDVFTVKTAVVVTQKYHLYRALQIGKALGLDVKGVASDQKSYAGQTYRDIREIAARIKDVFQTIIQPEPTYLGTEIPIDGDGGQTH